MDDTPTESLPALTVAGVLGPVKGSGHRELERLRAMPQTTTVRLRRAHIWLSTGGHNRAIQDLNRIIFGEPPPTAAEESFARFLRHRAYRRKGDTERSGHDLAMATELTHDPELRRLIADQAPRPVEREPERAGYAEMLPRSAWGAAAPRPHRMVPMTRVDRLTVHHSAMLARSASRPHSGAVVRAIQKNHIGTNGWGDIGYHYLIDREGRVWTGRPAEWQGAHAGDSASNRGNIGICLLGNFIRSSGGQNPSDPQLAALEELVGDLCRRFSIPPRRILTHRELHNTVCPGARLQVAVERMRRTLVAQAE